MVEVKSKFNTDLTKALLRFRIRRLWLLSFLLSTLCITYALVAIFSSKNAEIIVCIVLILIGVLFSPLPYWLAVLVQKIIDKPVKFIGALFSPLFYLFAMPFQKTTNKSLKLMGAETINNFTFYENIIYQHMERGDDYNETSHYRYVMLYRVYETKTHFFMYISNMQTHVIPKKDITVGTAQELSQFFSTNLGKKFKVYKWNLL